MTIDEKLDHMILMLEHMGRKVDTNTKELHEFRNEMRQETTMLRNQIASLTEALNSTIAENDAEHAEIRQMQEQHSVDIMKLRAAI